MKKFALLASGLLLSIGISWANVVGITNPALFADTVDWCQLGCLSGALATPEPWVSLSGATGLVGLVGTGQPVYNLVQVRLGLAISTQEKA
jgi:hypothetical protein